MNYELELAINYQVFDNFKQKGVLLLKNLFLNGRINDYIRFAGYGFISPLNEKSSKILVEEQDKFNRMKTNCLIYNLTKNKFNPGVYDKLFIYYSANRENPWYGYVLYNSTTGKTFNRYCIDAEDDRLSQYIFSQLSSLYKNKLMNFYSKRYDALKNNDFDNMCSVQDFRDIEKYYKEWNKLPFFL